MENSPLPGFDQCRKTKVKVDGRRDGGPEEDGCHKLEDTCTQKR